MIDNHDYFLLKIREQINRGTRHHFEDDIKRSWQEFRDLISLQATAETPTDFNWWMYRGRILALDLAKSRESLCSNNRWSRRN